MGEQTEERTQDRRLSKDGDEAVRQAAAYLDLWERNVCLTAIKGDVRVYLRSRGRKL